MRVKVEEPREKSKSRKVNSYVKARLVSAALAEASLRASQEITRLSMGLNGAQLAEAGRILGND